MSSSLLLKGTPAQIDPSLIPGGVVTDTINGLVGDITIAGGAGISIPAPVGQTITVNNAGVLSVAGGANTGISATTVAGATSLSLNFAADAAQVLLREVDAALAPVSNQPYVALYSGPYVVRATVISSNDGVGYAWVQGTDQINVVTLVNGVDAVDATVCVNSLVSAPAPGASVNTITSVIIVAAGDSITANVGSLGTPNLGAGGNVEVWIAPLIA